MLQQTQVATVIPFWERWMLRFPDVRRLAEASDQDVLSEWQGLGYYRRCRMLLQGARHVVEHGMPATAAGWKEVPGVGPYTAGAIASIAQGDPAAVVDGNVERVYARLTADPSSGAALNRAAWTWATENLRRDRPGDWNQALMELGATICRPIKPDCPRCPLRTVCEAYELGIVDDLPTRETKTATVRLRQTVWIPIFQGQIGLRQIPGGQWWEGMWEFPRADRAPGEENEPLRTLIGPGWVRHVGLVRHSVTHHRIEIDVSLVQCEAASPSLTWFSRAALVSLPLPAPQRKALALASPYL